MNAYELANKMEQLAGHFHNEAINMLRQQADRIAELERLVSDMIYEKASGVYQGKYLEQYWVKQQSAEPVAWWTGKFEDESEDFMFAKTRQAHIDHAQSCTHEFFPIPLYTTPQIKELDKSDIYAEALQAGIMLSTQYGQAENKLMPVSDGDTLVKFVRAILKKASEK